MDALHTVLYIAHMLALVAIVLAPVVHKGAASALQVWGARLQLLIGLGLTGLAEAGDDTVNHAKIGTKLIVMIAVVALSEISWAKQKRGEVAAPLPWIAAGLALLNAVIAFAW
ncbi:hypothetical protein [Janibacter sp. G1551]|uniref:hypothetical protein n=1 Tax=Janibacter sp. G1551 TaxID=3420440 RepID=UPI003D071410